jgi:hypothetical protein
MSERNENKFPTREVAIIGLGGLAIGGVLYIAYQYFVAPGNELVYQYTYVVNDILKEIKQFGEDNANANPPVYGLTTAQQQIIEEKKKILVELEPYVQQTVGRGNSFLDWLYDVIVTGLIIAGVTAGVIAAFRVKWGNWRDSLKDIFIVPASADFVVNACFDITSNIFAFEGKLNIASGIYNQMQAYYNTYTAPSLLIQQAFYNNWLNIYSQTAWQYAFASYMINTITFEASAAGIAGAALYDFWIPPI